MPDCTPRRCLSRHFLGCLLNVSPLGDVMSHSTKCVIFAVGMLMVSLSALSDVPTPGLKNRYKLPNIAAVCAHTANAGELAECLEAQYQKADRHLGKIEKDIAAGLEPTGAEKFQRVSVDWRAFVQSSCQFDQSGAMGNSSAQIYWHCMLDYSLARIGQLEKYSYCVSTEDCGKPIYLHLIASPVIYGN